MVPEVRKRWQRIEESDGQCVVLRVQSHMEERRKEVEEDTQ